MSDKEVKTASIACEPCRNKKCKCDRRLPICTQCKSSPARCQYPEKGRRGIPAGYVNALERRLAETERALFFALAEIHTGAVARGDYESPALRQAMGVSVSSEPTTQQDKAELPASWARTPLADRGQAQAWFEANKSEAAVLAFVESGADAARRGLDHVTPTSTVTSASSGRPVAELHRNSQTESISTGTLAPEIARRSSYREPARYVQGRVPGWPEYRPEVSSSTPGDEGDTPPARNAAQAGKARNLARANPNLYF